MIERRPRYNVCDRCGRNPHKVAVRRPIGHGFKTTKVVGYCPSCFADLLDVPEFMPADYVPFEDCTVVYDRRGAASKKKTPVPERMVRDGAPA